MRRLFLSTFRALPLLALVLLIAAAPATQPTAPLDAAIDSASRDVSAGISPESDCRRAESLLRQLQQSRAIDDATAQQYESQIAFARSVAADAVLTKTLKVVDSELAALELKLSDLRPRLLGRAADPTDARQAADELSAAARPVAETLNKLPQDDARVASLARRLAAVRQELSEAAARQTTGPAAQALRQQWDQSIAPTAGWQAERVQPLSSLTPGADPTASLTQTHALIRAADRLLALPALAGAADGGDADLTTLADDIRSARQSAITKSAVAIESFLDDADRTAPARGAAATEAASLDQVAQALRGNLSMLPDAAGLAARAQRGADLRRALAAATTPAIPAIRTSAAEPSPIRDTSESAIVLPTIAASKPIAISAPAVSAPVIPAPVAAPPISISPSAPPPATAPRLRTRLGTRLAWTLTGLVAAALAFFKSRTLPTPKTPARAKTTAWSLFLSNLDGAALVLALLGIWWLCSAPYDGLLSAAALIACALLAAGDALARHLPLSKSFPETARRLAGPTAAAAAIVFTLHLVIGGAAFL